MKKIKLCGMMNLIDIDYVNQAMPDYAGFIFADTRRKITHEQAMKFRKRLDPHIEAVGVFVNARVEEITGLVRNKVIDAVQLHGNEDADYIKAVRDSAGEEIKIFKAVRVKEYEDILRTNELDADYLLLDAYREGSPGGTGVAFDWQLIEKAKQACVLKPFFLAGGINLENLDEAMSIPSYGIDISSGIETDGKKDNNKIQETVRRIRNV